MGKCAASGASATSENPLESPAANPDHASAGEDRLNSLFTLAPNRFVHNLRPNREPFLYLPLSSARVWIAGDSSGAEGERCFSGFAFLPFIP